MHQDLGVIGDLSVLDNVALVAGYHRDWWVADRAEAETVSRLFEELELDLDPRRLMQDLSPPERTMVAIARAVGDLTDGGGALLLDEPTATLSERGTTQLFKLLRRIRALGTPIVYVTHRLTEVLELADRVTVLREGRRVTTELVADLDHDRLVELIVGGPVSQVYGATAQASRGDDALTVTDLRGAQVDGISFAVRRGEVLGLAGIEGSGREEVAELLFGAQPMRGGTMTFEGVSYTSIEPAVAIAAGVAYLPADRKRDGSLLDFTVRENLTLPNIGPGRGRWLSLRAERADARTWLGRLGIRPADPDRLFSSLSGGNQQRVLLARWLRCATRLFLLNEPTQGVDVHARSQIYAVLGDAAAKGAAVLIASSDAEELAMVCDRVLVMRGGVIVAELAGPDLTDDAIVHLSIATQPRGRAA